MNAPVFLNHDEDYPEDYMPTILKEVKTIAMVGASANPTAFSYGVLRVLHEFQFFLVTPRRDVLRLGQGQRSARILLLEALEFVGEVA